MKRVWPLRTLGLPLMGVVPALIVGIGIMRLHGAGWSMPLTNLVAAFVGLVGIAWGAPMLMRWTSRRPEIVACIVLAMSAATLLSEGLDGVHRWVRVGPIRLHPSAMGTPLVLLAIVSLWEQGRTALAVGVIGMGLALHIAQPDAGQATALAAASMALVVIPDKRHLARLVVFVLAVAGAIVAWMRPDPLTGVAMVEDMVPRAFSMHAGLGICAVVALAMLPGSALVQVMQSRTNRLVRVGGVVLAAYFAASVLVVAWGEFPTPVLGFGASPILGAVVGLGLLDDSRASQSG